MRHPIGVFDSGVGGISVLRVLRKLLPHEDFIYIGDCKNAPYGDKSVEEIDLLTHQLIQPLLDAKCKALVIACNTITAVSANALRKELTMPVIGMEPALKPAQALRKDGRVLVLATKATLALDKFHRLYEKYGQDTLPIVGEGLAALVENGLMDTPQAEKLLHRLLDEPLKRHTDAIVLGCTHYPFLVKDLNKVAPGIPLVDGSLGTARQVRRLLEQAGQLETEGEGKLTLLATGDHDGVHVRLMEKLLSAPFSSEEA